MKPRFSIFAVMGITAYIAVVAAALAQPLGLWPYVGLLMAVLTPLYLFPIAAGWTTKRPESNTDQ